MNISRPLAAVATVVLLAQAARAQFEPLRIVEMPNDPEAPMFEVPASVGGMDISAPGAQMPKELGHLFWAIMSHPALESIPQEQRPAHAQAILGNIIGAGAGHVLLTGQHAAAFTGGLGYKSKVKLYDLGDPTREIQAEIKGRVLDDLEEHWTGYAEGKPDQIMQLHRKLARAFDSAHAPQTSVLATPAPAPVPVGGGTPPAAAKKPAAPAAKKPAAVASKSPSASASRSAALNEQHLKILDALIERHQLSAADLAEQTELPEREVERRLKELESQDLVRFSEATLDRTGVKRWSTKGPYGYRNALNESGRMTLRQALDMHGSYVTLAQAQSLVPHWAQQGKVSLSDVKAKPVRAAAKASSPAEKGKVELTELQALVLRILKRSREPLSGGAVLAKVQESMPGIDRIGLHKNGLAPLYEYELIDKEGVWVRTKWFAKK